MKKLLFILFLGLMFIPSSFSQSIPQGMKYQAVARDLSGEVIANEKIELRIRLQSNLDAPKIHYTELHSIETNQFGLFSVTIGEGITEKGLFNMIPWSTEDIWMEIAIQDKGKTGFSTISNSKLLAVPYAFHAATASELVNGNLGEARPEGVPSQVWSLFGNSNSDPEVDAFGTTDYVDLVMITNDIERLRITKDGDINISNSLNVGNNVDIGNDLHVGNDTFLDNNVEMNIDGGTTTNNGDFTVANMSKTSLTGTLSVDGVTDLNNTLNVNNASATNLTGVLNVDGAADLNDTLNVDGVTDLNNTLNVNNASATNLTGVLNVDGATDLNNTLNVDGVTDLNNTLNVTNASATNLTGVLNVDGATDLNNTLNVDGATTINGTSALTGQVTINANVSGGDTSYGAYPLRVEGSAQGVAIKITAGTPDNNNNYVTFFNSSGSAVGRIEGETAANVASDPEFIFNEAILVATEIKAGVSVGLSFIPVVVGGVVVSTGLCGACIAMAAADLVLATANLIGYNVFAFENLGVTYQSGSADYAEWLERINPNEQMSPGEIVGVTSGKITKYTLNSKQYMVISTNPAMLGNMPMDGKDKLYEKVAFMGQIPVKVRGIVFSGDYIIPSGLNDGTGIAVSQDNIQPEQYSKIVGVAWSDVVIDKGISLVNMAIGLNSNDVAELALQQQLKLTNLETKLSNLEARFIALENGEVYKPIKTIDNVVTTDNQTTKYQHLVDNMPAELSAEVMEEAFTYLENMYKERGINIADHPGLNKLFTDASYKAEIIRKSQETYRVSYRKILEVARK